VIVYVVYDSDPGNPYNVGIFGLLLQKKRIFLCSVCIKYTHTHTTTTTTTKTRRTRKKPQIPFMQIFIRNICLS